MNVAGVAKFSLDDLDNGPLSGGSIAALRTHPLLPDAMCTAAEAIVAQTSLDHQ